MKLAKIILLEWKDIHFYATREVFIKVKYVDTSGNGWQYKLGPAIEQIFLKFLIKIFMKDYVKHSKCSLL